MQLSAIFPQKSLKELAVTVREVDGSFDAALGVLMSELDSSGGSSSKGATKASSSANKSSESHAEADLELDKNAAIIRLQSQYSRQLREIRSVIGEATQTEETILRTLEQVKGDAQEAIIALLTMPSAEQPTRTETSSSLEALRTSAANISASSTLKQSSGLEEMPINVKRDFLTPSEEAPLPAGALPLRPSNKPATITRKRTSPPQSPPKNDGGPISAATIECADDSAEENCEDDWGVVEYDDDDVYEDEVEYYFEEVDEETGATSESSSIALDETDYLTILLQQEVDQILAQQLAEEMAAAAVMGTQKQQIAPRNAWVPKPSGKYVPPPPNWIADPEKDKPRRVVVKAHPSKYKAVAKLSAAMKAAESLPAPLKPVQEQHLGHRKFSKTASKHAPAAPQSSYVPASSSSAPSPPSSEPAVPYDPTGFDSEALTQFMKEHRSVNPVSRSTADLPYLGALRKQTLADPLALASTIRRLRQLYEARLAALAGEEDSKQHKRQQKLQEQRAAQSEEAKKLSASGSLLVSSEIAPPQPASTDAPAPPAIFDITEYVDRMFAVACYKEPHEALQTQADEINSLRILFNADRLAVSESVPTIVCISLSEPSFELMSTSTVKGETAQLKTNIHFRNHCFLQLVAALPPFYPDVSPSISVRSMIPSCPIAPSILTRLEAFLKDNTKGWLGIPCLSSLVAEAETWLCDDLEMRRAMLLDFRKNADEDIIARAKISAGTLGGRLSERHLFASLNKLFNFERDYSVLDTHDVINQRSKLLKRAIAVLINGRNVVYGETPGNPAMSSPSGDANDSSAFPILVPGTGEVDEEASLRGLGLTVGAVRIILQHYNWNLGKLGADYLSAVARGTYEKFLSDAGVAPVADRYAMQRHLKRAMTEVLECPTCLDTRPFHAMFGLVCGHMLCKQCYSEYVDYEVSRGMGLSNLSCPSPGCKYTVDQASLAGLLSPQRWASYVNLVVSQFVQASPTLQWCPSGKGCQRIIQEGALDSEGVSVVLAGEASESIPEELRAPKSNQTPLVIQCACTYTFCNACGVPGGHFPASCTEISSWLKAHPDDEALRNKESDESRSEQFLRQFTRPCPNCTAAISKNGGCVHMRCRACSYEYCWVCHGRWSTSHYACTEGSKRPVLGEADAINFPDKIKNFDELLQRHRQYSFPSVAKLRSNLVDAIYRTPRTYKKNQTPGANAINAKNHELDREINIDDITAFIDILETIFLADYIVSNSCRAGFSIKMRKEEKSGLISTIGRALDDLGYLCATLNSPKLKKNDTLYLTSGASSLKISIQLVVSKLTKIRLAHLHEISEATPSLAP